MVEELLKSYHFKKTEIYFLREALNQILKMKESLLSMWFEIGLKGDLNWKKKNNIFSIVFENYLIQFGEEVCKYGDALKKYFTETNYKSKLDDFIGARDKERHFEESILFLNKLMEGFANDFIELDLDKKYTHATIKKALLIFRNRLEDCLNRMKTEFTEALDEEIHNDMRNRLDEYCTTYPNQCVKNLRTLIEQIIHNMHRGYQMEKKVKDNYRCAYLELFNTLINGHKYETIEYEFGLRPILRNKRNKLFIISDIQSDEPLLDALCIFKNEKGHLVDLIEDSEDCYPNFLKIVLSPKFKSEFKNRIKTNKNWLNFPIVNRIKHTMELFNVNLKKSDQDDKILICDLETTGVNPNDDLIIEIAMVLLDLKTGEYKTIINSIVNNGVTDCHANSHIFKMSDLDFKEIRKAPPLDNFAIGIQALLHIYPITSFFRKFDIGFLERFGFRIPINAQCPMEIMTNVLKIPHDYYGFKNASLKESYDYWFPKESSDTKHRALDDTIKCAKIVFSLYKNDLMR